LPAATVWVMGIIADLCLGARTSCRVGIQRIWIVAVISLLTL